RYPRRRARAVKDVDGQHDRLRPAAERIDHIGRGEPAEVSRAKRVAVATLGGAPQVNPLLGRARISPTRPLVEGTVKSLAGRAAGESEPALGDDVALDLVGAAAETQVRRLPVHVSRQLSGE